MRRSLPALLCALGLALLAAGGALAAYRTGVSRGNVRNHHHSGSFPATARLNQLPFVGTHLGRQSPYAAAPRTPRFNSGKWYPSPASPRPRR